MTCMTTVEPGFCVLLVSCVIIWGQLAFTVGEDSAPVFM